MRLKALGGAQFEDQLTGREAPTRRRHKGEWEKIRDIQVQPRKRSFPARPGPASSE